ncbi:hypothetical protein DPMN_061587 [Dreissena polymorpha]|uniref:Uncharacterized protein n=1 Tax=Dreissena polymorpha TaxID=45954 RepID=A0A9D4C7Q7_DREPO|nr:hypothetical protein DPMN_061587 [Dreissena polymorpha]
MRCTIYEKYPDYLFVKRHLRAMCFHFKCQPTFKEMYKDFMKEQAFDWRTEAYAIHFTYPDPEELTDEKKCRGGEGKFADICTHIFKYEQKKQVNCKMFFATKMTRYIFLAEFYSRCID